MSSYNYQLDLLFRTAMIHIHTPYLLNRLGTDDLTLVHPAMVLSGNRIIHHDTVLVSRQRPLAIYYAVLAVIQSHCYFNKENSIILLLYLDIVNVNKIGNESVNYLIIVRTFWPMIVNTSTVFIGGSY